MKTRWKILRGFVIVSGALAAWVQADFREWDLKNQVPTTSVKDSKLYRVFETQLAVFPVQFELGGTHFYVKAAWLEHRTVPRRTSMFYTQQDILPDLILCIDLGSKSTMADIWIKDAERSHILFSGVNGVRFSEIGTAPLRSFSLCTRDGKYEVEIRIQGAEQTRPANVAARRG